jgi:hypothetical protein
MVALFNHEDETGIPTLLDKQSDRLLRRSNDVNVICLISQGLIVKSIEQLH